MLTVCSDKERFAHLRKGFVNLSTDDGRWVLVALLSILLSIVTCKDDAPATSSEPWDPFGHLDLAVGDSSEIDAPVEDGVSSDEETDEMRFDLPLLEVARELCFDDLYRPNTPSLFIENESLFLFYNATLDEEDTTDWLYLQTSPLATFEFGEAQQVVNQGYQVDLVGHEGVLWALVAGGWLSSYWLMSDDGGESWRVDDVLPAGNDSPSCRYQVPSYVVRPLSERFDIVLGYDVDSHIFGCGHQLYFTYRQDEDFVEPVSVTNGTPSGAYASDDRIVVATTGAVVYSDDSGESWQQVPGGDTTQDQVRGSRLVRGDDGTLYLVQTYGYGSVQTLAVLVSRDNGSSWDKWILQEEDDADVYFTAPTIAIDGQKIAVLWRLGDRHTILGSQYRYSAMAMLSVDSGRSWTEPTPFELAREDENVTDLTVAFGDTQMFAAYTVTGEGIYYDFHRVCVAAIELPE